MLKHGGNIIQEESEVLSNVTGFTGRPILDDAISTVSFDLRAHRTSNILDSEVKGNEKFAKMNVPASHISSGRGKNRGLADSVCKSEFTNKLSESSRSHAPSNTSRPTPRQSVHTGRSVN